MLSIIVSEAIQQLIDQIARFNWIVEWRSEEHQSHEVEDEKVPKTGSYAWGKECDESPLVLKEEEISP